ncbi:MAG: hypothetical protein IMX00_08755 [Limnochordales bacterium]|nr:hypothetical protein [Limnochordales bacterium]
MMRSQNGIPDGIPVQKPYDFVPWGVQEPHRTPPTRDGHSVLADGNGGRAGRVDFTIITKEVVHVGNGRYGFVTVNKDEWLVGMAVGARRWVIVQGNSGGEAREVSLPVIPGSTLKGVIRSVAEALSGSCAVALGPNTRPSAGRFRPCRRVDQLCPCCRLFGTTAYAGHFQVQDVTAADRSAMGVYRMPLLWKPGGGRGLPERYRAVGTPGLVGRKFYFHRRHAKGGSDPRLVIKPNVQLSGRILFDNVELAELGLLVAAMGCAPGRSFPIKLGAGKPVGMGSVECRIDRVVLFGGARGADASVSPFAGRLGGERHQVFEGEALGELLQRAVQEAMEQNPPLVIPSQLERLRQIWSPEGLEKEASAGPY